MNPVILTSLLQVRLRAPAAKSTEPLIVSRPLLVVLPRLLAVVTAKLSPKLRAVVLSEDKLPLLRVMVPVPSALLWPAWIEPVEIVVPPEYELFPVRMAVPEPTFCSASVPPLFWMTPENVLETLLLLMRNVLPATLALIVPLPLRLLI